MNRFRQLPIIVAIVAFVILLISGCVSVTPTPEVEIEKTTAIGIVQETSIMTPQKDQKVLPLNRAIVLNFLERMGLETQTIQKDVTNQLQRGDGEVVQISSGQILEDYQATEQMVLLFPAAPINNLDGLFALTLESQHSTKPDESGVLAIRQAWMERRGDRFVVLVEVKSKTGINNKWTYTRYPETRQVYLAVFDDPNEVIEAEVFHQVPFQAQPTTPEPVPGIDWTIVEFNLPRSFIEQSTQIDQCEILLERLDPEFRADKDEFLQWQKNLVTPETIDRVASDLEERMFLPEGKVFNVKIQMVGQEFIRNKRIQPFVEHPITLFENDGSPRAGNFGCSISN